MYGIAFVKSILLFLVATVTFRITNTQVEFHKTLLSQIEELKKNSYQQYQGRPVPAELQVMFDNKTLEDDDLQECMKEFALCMSVQRQAPFCATNKEGIEKTFFNVCDFNYENCKSWSGYIWKISDDKKCDDES